MADAVHCHVKSYEFDEDGAERTIDYDRFFGVARKHDYDGPLSIEIIPKLGEAVPLVWFCLSDSSLAGIAARPGVDKRVIQGVTPLRGTLHKTAGALREAVAGCVVPELAAEAVEAVLACAERLDPDFEHRRGLVRQAVDLLTLEGAAL